MDFESQVQLAKGIEAAKQGDLSVARQALYAVLDLDPKNEMAWIWLSSVVETVEDRQICLENILLLNPHNDYARRSLDQIAQLGAESRHISRPTAQTNRLNISMVAYRLTTAFWLGLSCFSIGLGLIDLFNWGLDWLRSRAFPHYITPTQLFNLVSTIAFLIFGILLANITWALFRKHKFGYLGSLLTSLGLILIGPTVVFISESPSYLLAIFVTLLPTLILFLTLLSQTGFDYDRHLAPYPKRNQTRPT